MSGMLAVMVKPDRGARAVVTRAFRDVSRTSASPTLVDELALAVRADNCLKKAKIATVKQLLRRSMFDLFKMRNLGTRTLREIVEVLGDSGLALRPDKYDRVMHQLLRKDALLAGQQSIKRQTEFVEALRARSAAIRDRKDGA